jgi:type I restriction-modification system DNA methylase subunit
MAVLTLDEIVCHIRGRAFMSSIVRDRARVEDYQEVFTPTPIVRDLLSRFDPMLFMDDTKVFCDPCCGDGQFLGEVLIKKVALGSSFEQALMTIYGVDILEDNVLACRNHLLCGQEQYRDIVERNIVHADALVYDFKFGDTDSDGVFAFPPTTIAVKQQRTSARKSTPQPLNGLFE